MDNQCSVSRVSVCYILTRDDQCLSQDSCSVRSPWDTTVRRAVFVEQVINIHCDETLSLSNVLDRSIINTPSPSFPNVAQNRIIKALASPANMLLV